MHSMGSKNYNQGTNLLAQSPVGLIELLCSLGWDNSRNMYAVFVGRINAQ